MKSKLLYLLTYVRVWLLAILPSPVLCALPDLIYPWLYHVIGYRRKVVDTNLRNSFPEKSATELKATERKFHHYLCGYMPEDVRILRMSGKELCRYMTYGNKEAYLQMIDERDGIALPIPHYADFEQIMGVGMTMRPSDAPVQAYKLLRDVHLDGLLKHIRSHFGGYNVPKHSTAREAIRLRRDGEEMTIGLITDQPSNANEVHRWTTFLNQDAVFTGSAECVAKMTNFPVLYRELYKEWRGYCRIEFDSVTDRPRETADNEVTEIFARRSEQTTRRGPAYQLWSYRRWKLKRPKKKDG